MASSLAYIHVSLPLNLTTIYQQIIFLKKFLEKVDQGQPPSTLVDEKTVNGIKEIAKFFLSRVDRLASTSILLDNILPTESDLAKQPGRSRRDDKIMQDYFDKISPLNFSEMLRVHTSPRTTFTTPPTHPTPQITKSRKTKNRNDSQTEFFHYMDIIPINYYSSKADSRNKRFIGHRRPKLRC
jgi:hypothetical protein